MHEVLGKYHLIHKIGEGGMAEIFLAVSDGHPYAFKRLRQERSDEKDVVEDFLREVRIGNKIDHPNLLRIVDSGKIGKNYFAVMELALGLSVQELIVNFASSKNTIPLSLALYIITETCHALSYIHRMTIFDYSDSYLFHGDISPHNLLMTHEGMLKLIDFGSAGQVGKTDSGRVHFAKLFYLPPEVLSGSSPDTTTDLYSLGVVSFYLLFGRLPFESKNKYELTEMIKNSQPPKYDTSHLLKNLKDESTLRLFFNRALNKEKRLRFKSADEFEKVFLQLKFREQPISDITKVSSHYPKEFSSRLLEMDSLWQSRLAEFKRIEYIYASDSVQLETESLLARINRRRHPRVSVEELYARALVSDIIPNGNLEFPIHEISRGGMLLGWEQQPTSISKEYRVTIQLGTKYVPINTNARFLYRSKRSTKHFAGFQFTNISGEGLQLLDQFVESHSKDIDLANKATDTVLKQIFIYVYFNDLGAFTAEFEKNIQHGGIFLESDKDLRQDDQAFIRIHLPETFQRIILKGKVVFIKHGVDTNNGVALQLEINTEQIVQIQEFLHKLKRQN